MKEFKKTSEHLYSGLKKALIPCILAVVLLLSAQSCSGSDKSPSDTELKLALLESRLAALQASSSALEEKYAEDKRALESKLDELNAIIEALPPTVEEEPVEKDKVYFGFSYIIEGDGATITAYSGDSTEIIIPASIQGHPVVAIADEAFKGLSIISVSIPETIERIGWFTFASCPRLERIVIPKKVKEIGYGAFDGSPLVSVYTPSDSYAAKYAKSYGIPVSSD